MLNKYYNFSSRKFNPEQEKIIWDWVIEKKWKNLTYYTKKFEDVFENIDVWTLNIDIEKQFLHIEKEVNLYLKYDYFTKAVAEKIIEQYRFFYYYQWFYYNIWELRDRLFKKHSQENTFIGSDPNHISNLNEEFTNKKPVIEISRDAIRKITWYSPYVIPAWAEDWKSVYIEWQDRILEDESAIIVVDWSRQIWKSLTIAEKAVESSFIPNEHTLVWAFIKKTTDVIRNYILKHTEKFPEWTFEHFKSEWFILNVKSWTKIYFRTLDNWAENVRWLTLRNVIVDEAQLVATEVFEDVLFPTLSTTDGKMILIWTPWKSEKWYYYDLVMEARRWTNEEDKMIAAKCENNPDLSYYKINIHENPLISPRIRKNILLNKEKASFQREYFNNWHAWSDKLFNPELMSNYPSITKDWYIVITFDPAKWWVDKSAFSVLYVFNWMIYLILSWSVPKAMKKKWSNQVSFYNKWVLKTFSEHKNLVLWVDIRWVWEWFTEAFKNSNPKKSLIEISYTDWDEVNIKWLDWKIPKHLLITNKLDFIDDWFFKVLKSSCWWYVDEINFCFEDQDRKRRVKMKTSYKDDEINAVLTWLFIVKQRNLLSRSYVINHKENNQQFDDWILEWVNDKKTIKKKKGRKNKKVW